MNKTFLSLGLALIASTALAEPMDTVILLTNGSAQVWAGDVYQKNESLCTQKPLMEDCIDRRSIAKIYHAEHGTVDAREIGGADGSLPSMSNNMWAAQWNENAERAAKQKKDASYAAQQRERQRDVKLIGEDRVLSRERSGNSAGGK